LPQQPTAPTDTPVVWVLQGSHYAERVLWAAELANWPVQLRVLAPGPHVWALRRAAPQLRATHLPVLMAPRRVADKLGAFPTPTTATTATTATTVQGSDAILDHMGWPVLHGDQAALQQALVHALGPAVRQAFYAALCQQPSLARGWALDVYASAPAAVRALAQHWPRAVLRALLRREGVRAAQLPGLLQALPKMAAPHDAVVDAALAALAARAAPAASSTTPSCDGPANTNTAEHSNSNSSNSNSNICTGAHRLALTAGALLGPVLLPLPAPWQTSPWPPDLLAQVQALQHLPLWQLAHAAWALRAAQRMKTPARDS
jgi:hypothetical protein